MLSKKLTDSMSNKILQISGIFMFLFGLLSLFMSTSILLDLFGIREKEGHYVPFIVYANFICSFFYLFSGYGFFTKKKWTTVILFIAVALLITAYIGLIFHIQAGKAFEIQTVKAMLLRVSLTIVFAGISWYYISRTKLTLN